MFGKANMSTGMPQLTITNHSELYPEVLNSLNKMLLMKCQSQLHNKIRKHAMKQARRNPPVVRIFCSVVYYLVLGASRHSRK